MALHTYLASSYFAPVKQAAMSLLSLYAQYSTPSAAPQLAKKNDYAILHSIFQKCSQPTPRGIEPEFETLSSKTCGKLFGIVYEIAKPKTSNPKWGEQHIFDDYQRLKSVIKAFAIRSFDALDAEHMNVVAGRVYQFSGNPRTHQRQWGKVHAKDNIEILLRALSAGIGSPSISYAYETSLKHKSSLYSLQRKELPRGQISYINGMGTHKTQAKKDAEHLSTHLARGYNFHCVHAAPNGKLQDLQEMALLHSGVLTPSVHLLHRRWKEFFAKSGPNEKYLQICHSKGVALVKGALEHFDPSLRKKIIVLALAPADFIPKKLCHRVKHFVIKEDPVPFLSPNASRIYSNDPDIVILPANKGTSPHNPHGKSYREAASKEVRKYLQECEIR